MTELSKSDARFVLEEKNIKTVDLWPNTGQISGLPANPRFIEEAGLEDLQRSVREIPEFLYARKLIVIPYAGVYVVLCGNMRLRACINEHVLEVPCIVLNPDTPLERLKRYLIVDNVSYGKNDWDMIANEWEIADLKEWGMELPYFDTPGGDGDDTGTDGPKEYKIMIECGYDEMLHFRVKNAIEELLNNYPGVEMKG